MQEFNRHRIRGFHLGKGLDAGAIEIGGDGRVEWRLDIRDPRIVHHHCIGIEHGAVMEADAGRNRNTKRCMSADTSTVSASHGMTWVGSSGVSGARSKSSSTRLSCVLDDPSSVPSATGTWRVDPRNFPIKRHTQDSTFVHLSSPCQQRSDESTLIDPMLHDVANGFGEINGVS